MTDRVYIRVRNQDGDTKFYDTDYQSGYPSLTGFGFGKSFESVADAQAVIKREFPVQKQTDRTPPYLIHNGSGVNNAKPKGWVKVDVVRMVAESVEDTEIHRHATIRPESPADLRASALFKLTPAERKALGL